MKLLFVDEHVVVADKPSGLLVHRGWDNDEDVAMFRVRDAIGAHVHPVHRLDRGTSGVLVFARSTEIAAELSRTWERVTKRYIALVRGGPPNEGVIDHPIPKSEGGPRVRAVTRFRLIARSTVDRCALVQAEPRPVDSIKCAGTCGTSIIRSSATSTTARARSIDTTARRTDSIGSRCTRIGSHSRIP